MRVLILAAVGAVLTWAMTALAQAATPPPTAEEGATLAAWSNCTGSNIGKLAIASRESAEAVVTAALVRCTDAKLTHIKAAEKSLGPQGARESAVLIERELFRPTLIEQVVTIRARRGL